MSWTIEDTDETLELRCEGFALASLEKEGARFQLLFPLDAGDACEAERRLLRALVELSS